MPPKGAPKVEQCQKMDHHENELFKQLVKQYDDRTYSKGLHTASTILKKYPDHGDTLAMKGLITNCLGRRAEAIELVKQGLTASQFKSHVCWHVYGGILKQEKNFDQAIRCFKSAVKLDSSNQQVWRELANLQMIRMDLPGLLESRHKLVELKSNQKANWTGYALAQHLNKNYMVAVQLLDTMERELGPPEAKVEVSELHMYKVALMIEAGEYEQALKYLEKNSSTIVDVSASMERKAECYIKLGQSDKAAEVYLKLLKAEAPNRNTLACYVRAKGVTALSSFAFDPKLSEGDRSKVHGILKELEGSLGGKDTLIPRILLDFSPLDDFKQRVRAFLLKYVRKTIPSIFGALKSIYRYPDRVAILGDMLQEWDAGLKQKGQIPGEEYSGPEDKEYPFVNLWVTYTLAGHHYRLKNFEKALEIVEAVIKHTPTVEMMFVMKARVLKHLGRLGEAWEAMDRARKLDLQDRYLNTKATKYCLRNNQIREAEKTIALFTTGAAETPNYNAPIEMQAMWYEMELGAAYMRLGDPHGALKKWLLIDRHFKDMTEDQFDFFLYCMRKFTLLPFMEVFRFTQRARGHANFQKMARQAIPAYMELARLQAAGEKGKEVVIERDDQEALDKAAEEKRQKAAEADEPEEANLQESIKVETEKPLEAAAEFLEELCKYSPQALSTHTLGCLLFSRMEKPALLVRHLLAGQDLLASAKPGEAEEFRAAAKEAKAVVEKTISDVDAGLRPIVEAQRKLVTV